MTTTYVPDDIETRRNALALFNAASAASKAYEDNDPDQSGISDDELDANAKAAWDAYEAADGPALMTDIYDEKAHVCAVSGVPLWAEDEVLEDADTGEYVLRAAVGLPPRPKTTDDETDDDVEEAA